MKTEIHKHDEGYGRGVIEHREYGMTVNEIIEELMYLAELGYGDSLVFNDYWDGVTNVGINKHYKYGVDVPVIE